MSKIKCKLCKSIVEKSEAPFPVISHKNGFNRLWYCSQECMGIVWPDAVPPVQLGDLFTCDYIAFIHPRQVVEMDEYDRLTATEEQGGGFECMSIDDLPGLETLLPYDQWAIVSVHPDDPDMFFLVPWTGDEEMAATAKSQDMDDDAEGAMYLVCEAEAIYVAWQHKDKQESKKPRQVFLFLGRGIWRHRNELELSARQQRLTENSVEEVRKSLARTAAPLDRG